MPKYSTSSSMMTVDYNVEQKSESMEKKRAVCCVGGGKNENEGVTRC